MIKELKLLIKLLPEIQKLKDGLNSQNTLNNKIHAKIEILSYHTNHRILEERARQKVRDGKKLKVFFLVSYSSKFGFESIYRAMEQSGLFNPYIFLVHPRDKLFYTNEKYIEEVHIAYETFLEQGYRVILGYDEKMRPVGLEKNNPDIVFLNFPNMFQGSYYKNININYNYLTCYITYGMCVVKNFNYHFENYHINSSWKIFSETYYSYYQAVEKSIYNGVNVILTGYPKLDQYYIEDRCNVDKRKSVIYAPHWSIKTKAEDNNMSTFHLYYRYFLNMLEQYPEIDFYFKPHPDLHYRIQELYDLKIDIGISPKEYEHYVSTWQSKKNGYVVLDGEYISLFKDSVCLITDSLSFIAEYLPANKPCIYLLNPEKKNPYESLNEFGKMILETYYCCLEENEITEIFEQTVLENRDVKKEKRKDILEKEFVNLGNSGNYICDYLTKVFT